MAAARYAVPAAILLAALAILGIGIDHTGIAAAYSDPVAHIRAQDEPIYANSAITMALEGDWMTPKVLGRIFLYKPPLQLWLSAFSLKSFGISLVALRLPMWIAGALGALLLLLWCTRTGSRGPGLMVVLLLLSNPLWHIFSRLCYTDILLAVFSVTALYFLIRDPRLESRSALLGFAAATAAAIMTKNVAGVLPVFVLLLDWAIAPRAQRPAVSRLVQVSLLTGFLIAPWHVYQLLEHPRWFWTDYAKLEILGFGLHPPAQASHEFPLLFYVRRLFLVDPTLCLLALIAAPSLWVAVRRGESAQPALLVSWIIVVCAVLSVFQSRNFPYALFLVAPLCLLAALYGPLATPRRQRWAIAALCLVFGAKAFVRDQPWSLSFGRSEPLAAASILRSYSDRGRPNSLVLVDTDDEFYSATLPLPKVHYCFVDPNGVVQRYAPHYPYLGITVTADQFDELDRWEPEFRAHLLEWGLDSVAPVATAIVARSDADVLAIIRAHPLADFYLPLRFQPEVESWVQTTHDMVRSFPERFLLLAKQSPPVAAPRAAHWPKNW